jgi:hypothetical protein
MSSTPNIDWKTDRVFNLVFQHFENAWAEAHGDAKCIKKTPYDSPPYEFHITQFSRVNLKKAPRLCRGNPIRSWIYKGDEFKEVQLKYIFRKLPMFLTIICSFFKFFFWEDDPEDDPIARIERCAGGCFYISPDRETVVIEYVFGPLYGRGFVFLVQGQGENCRLVHKPGASEWIS